MAGYTYMLASRPRGALYVGVTADICARIFEHQEGTGSAHCRKYDIKRLVRLERFDDIRDAIDREKRLKKWPRAWKINLIESGNRHGAT